MAGLVTDMVVAYGGGEPVCKAPIRPAPPLGNRLEVPMNTPVPRLDACDSPTDDVHRHLRFGRISA